MFLYIIAYDIPCDKRRKKVSDLLEGYGRRVQYSVFECQLTTDKYNKLFRNMKKLINIEEDSLRFYPLSRHTLLQVEILGVGPPVIESPGSVII
jgi:CRISPR-associated protein Cas2